MRLSVIAFGCALSLAGPAQAATQYAPVGTYFFSGGADEFSPPRASRHQPAPEGVFFIPKPGYRKSGYECIAIMGLVLVKSNYARRMGTICRPAQI